MQLHHAYLDGVVVGAVVHEVPGPLGDFACVLRGRVCGEFLDQSELESFDLIRRMALLELRERLINMGAPRVRRDDKPIPQYNAGFHRRETSNQAVRLSSAAVSYPHFAGIQSPAPTAAASAEACRRRARGSEQALCRDSEPAALIGKARLRETGPIAAESGHRIE